MSDIIKQRLKNNLKEISETPGNIGGFILVTINDTGAVNIAAEGNVLNVSFMGKNVEIFVSKLISGELPNNNTTQTPENNKQ